MRFCKVLLNGDVLFQKARLMNSFFERLRGLMLKKEIGCDALVFKDCGSIHSLFCVIPFNALFIGKNGKILNHFSNIMPNKILPPAFKTKFLVEYLGEPLSFGPEDTVEIVEILEGEK